MAGKKGLTEKQEAFALAYFETGNAAEAYRRAYDVDDGAKDGWLYVEACQLLDHPKVSLRLNELRSKAEELAIYSVLEASAAYEKARKIAEEERNPAAMVSAITGRVKLFGLEAASKRKLEVMGRDGKPIQTEEVGKGASKLAEFLNGIAERSGAAGESAE